MKKILVLTDDLPWGHRSIARAIFDYLKENEKNGNFIVEMAEIKAETVFISDLYVFAYRYFPTSPKLVNKASGTKMGKRILKEVSILNLKNIKDKITKIDPDLIISTYFLHSHSLAYWREKKQKKFKLWSVVPDPWTINPMSFVKEADLNLVYDEVGVRKAIDFGINRDKIFKTGWWTRPSMYKKYNYKDSRQKLGFKDDRPVIFIGGGSLGTNALPKLLPVMLILDTKVGFVINTGVDKLAFNLVDQFIKVFKRIRKDDLVQIKHLGWIENMTEVLSACDMVLGKAGPNFLFDCVACKKPFVAITHISGQEDGNLDLIKKKKMGWIKEKNGEAVKFLKDYLEKPKYFEEKYVKDIKNEAERNQKTLPMILEMVKKELNKN